MRARGAGQSRGEVCVVAHDLRRLMRRLLERRLVGRGVVAGVRSVVPHDLQRLAALHRSPSVLRDNGNPAQGIEMGRRRTRLDFHYAYHARHLARLSGVVALDLSAVHRWTRHKGIEHAGQSRIDAVLGFPGRNILTVDELELALADIAELRRILETNRLPRGNGHAGGRLGEGAVAETPPGRTMHDLVVLRFHFADRHLPARSGSRFQHLARRRATAAHGFEEMARAA